LSLDDNSLYRVTESLDSTKIGTIPVEGDLWEIVSAPEENVYIVDRASNTLLTVRLNDASVLTSVQLDNDVYVSTRGLDVSSDNTMYGLLPGLELRTVDPLTGTTHFLTTITGTARLEALAISPDGTFYLAGNPDGDKYSDNLYTLNIETGSVSLVGIMNVSDIDTLSFGPDGFLYGTDSEAGILSELYKIDPITASVQNLGSLGLIEVNGLLAIPEPCALCLLGLGGLVLVRKRKSLIH
jgi:hypothetical protein